MTRCLVLLAGALALGLTLGPTPAEEPSKMPIVGVLVPSIGSDDPLINVMRDSLRELGYVEGRNIRIEFRSAQGKLDRLPTLAEELVRLKVDIIVAGAEPAILAAKQATRTIPIVMVGYVYDPVASGLIDSFARPGRNLTGVYTRTSELTGKRLELLKEMIPGLARVAILWDSFGQRELEELEPAARALGVRVTSLHLRAPYDFKAAFKTAKERKAGAVLLFFSSEFFVARSRIAASAIEYGLPMAAGFSQYTVAGGLVSYGGESDPAYHRVAYFVDRLLKGAKASDLPVEQTATFKLAVNLRTAKALGLSVPESILLRADEVIK